MSTVKILIDPNTSWEDKVIKAISLSWETIEEWSTNESFEDLLYYERSEHQIDFPLGKGEKVFCLFSRTQSKGWYNGYNDSLHYEDPENEVLFLSKSQDEIKKKKEETIKERFKYVLQELFYEMGVEIPCPTIKKQEEFLGRNYRDSNLFCYKESIDFFVVGIEVI